MCPDWVKILRKREITENTNAIIKLLLWTFSLELGMRQGCKYPHFYSKFYSLSNYPVQWSLGTKETETV